MKTALATVDVVGGQLAGRTDTVLEVRAPFPAGSRVKHEDYGEGVVTHAGTKDTNVAVLFDDPPGGGKKSRQVSRGSLKSAE